MTLASPRCDYDLAFAGASHTGLVRPANEDVWRADLEVGLFLVADGMGGHAAGEVAAALGADTLRGALRVPEAVQALDGYLAAPTLPSREHLSAMLRWAMERAHARIQEESRQPSRRGMGCTLDAVLLIGVDLFLMHVGDCRTYLSRQTATLQLTHDHTHAAALVARGIGTPTRPAGGSSALVNAMGQEKAPKVEQAFVSLATGDRVLLCTDGVHRAASGEQELTELVRAGSPQEAVHALIAKALERGGKDNATAVVVDVGPRLAQRAAWDGGQRARDVTLAGNAPLLASLEERQRSRLLAATIEVSVAAGTKIPRFFTDDRVAYLVVDGTVKTPEGWSLGASSVLYPESLAGGGQGTELCEAETPVRVLRLRRDDFREVAASDPALGAALWEQVARLLVTRT
jgi:serine/threonine protein phosphatase PrpC